MSTSGIAKDGPAAVRGRGSRASQRCGNVTGPYSPAGGPGGPKEGYLVRDEDTGVTTSFVYASLAMSTRCRRL